MSQCNSNVVHPCHCKCHCRKDAQHRHCMQTVQTRIQTNVNRRKIGHTRCSRTASCEHQKSTSYPAKQGFGNTKTTNEIGKTRTQPTHNSPQLEHHNLQPHKKTLPQQATNSHMRKQSGPDMLQKATHHSSRRDIQQIERSEAQQSKTTLIAEALGLRTNSGRYHSSIKHLKQGTNS